MRDLRLAKDSGHVMDSKILRDTYYVQEYHHLTVEQGVKLHTAFDNFNARHCPHLATEMREHCFQTVLRLWQRCFGATGINIVIKREQNSLGTLLRVSKCLNNVQYDLLRDSLSRRGYKEAASGGWSWMGVKGAPFDLFTSAQGKIHNPRLGKHQLDFKCKDAIPLQNTLFAENVKAVLSYRRLRCSIVYLSCRQRRSTMGIIWSLCTISYAVEHQHTCTTSGLAI